MKRSGGGFFEDEKGQRGLFYGHRTGWRDTDTAVIDTLALVFEGAATALIANSAIIALHSWADAGQPEARRP